MTPFFRRLATRLSSLSLASAAVFAFGCSSGPATQLTVTCKARQSQSFTESFPAAYFTQDAAGNTDVVLMDDAARKALDGEHGDSPIRQVMHIRVLWKPTRDSKADHTSASNATLHWYVMRNAPRSADVIEYAGTAMVVLEPGEGQTGLSIRTASFQPVACRGGLRDPIGPAMLQGTVHAAESLERVRLALKSVCAAVANANALSENATARNVSELPSSSAR